MDLDFSNLRFPIDKEAPGTDLLKKYPELGEIKEFSEYKNADKNKVIRYVIYLYSPKTPLVKRYTDLNKRKEAAADLAGFERDPKSGVFKGDIIHKIFEMEPDVIPEGEDDKRKPYQSANDLILAWLKFCNDMLWIEIIVTEHRFFESTKMILEAIEGKDSKNRLDALNVKSKAQGDLSALRKQIVALYAEFYGENIEVREKAKPFKPETITHERRDLERH